MSDRNLISRLLVASFSLCISLSLHAQTAQPVDLAAGFANPPDTAKPHTWWHWMNGNVSKAGITLDLEAMKRVGIGGAQLAQVGTGIPKGPVPYDSPEMVDMVRFALQEANRLGLDLCLFNCPGWSSSGGPWITPENSMKVLVFTETPVSGGKKVSITLPQPAAKMNFYRDVTVVAYPTVTGESRIPSFNNGLVAARGPTTAPVPAVDPNVPPIDPKKVIDLSSMMNAGALSWDAPPGEWTVLRVGFTTNERQNHPGPDGGVGLEVDKFSKEALDVHFEAFFNKYYDVMKPLAARGKVAALIDSYEAGLQNWTDKFPQEFKARRGYDMLPYMPAMAKGMVVGNAEISQRFLWDVRKTQAELMNENYYAHFTELCHQHGMQSFFEPYDNGNFDEMVAGAYADMPMGEFWQNQPNQRSIKLVASVLHMNGKSVMGAESFTSQSRWTEFPYSLKALGDFMWSQGLNKFVFHRYAMQPNPDPSALPGMTMGPWGGHFDRTNTWFDHGMSSWLTYVQRSQFMLQQGLFVGDLAYFCGEDSPARNPDESHLDPAPPLGYGYDTIDPVTLKKRVKISDGKLTLPDGLQYRLLVLSPTVKAMSVEVLQNIHDLVEQGMCVMVNGPKFEHSPSLMGYPNSDAQVAKLAGDLWGDMNGTTVTEHTFGKGRVFWGVPLASLIGDKLATKADFEFTSREGNPEIHYIHKRVGDSEVYFVANRMQRGVDLVCTFNVNGKQPEFWDAVSGTRSAAPVFDAVDGRTRMPIRLEASGAMFVVFHSPAPAKHINMVMKDNATLLGIAPFAMHGDPEDASPAIPRPPGGGRPPQFAMAMPKLDEPPAMEMVASAGGAMLAWQNGDYVLKNNQNTSTAVTISNVAAPVEISGAWTVNFPPNLGAPPSISLEKLISLTEHANPGVKNFSGTATYVKKVSVPADATANGKRLFLDLGRVQVIAQVMINGKDLGYLWMPPFRLDVTDAVHAGENDLEIRVTDLWTNRLIGDEALPPDNQYNTVARGSTAPVNAITTLPDWYIKGLPKPPSARVTFTTWHHWTADAPLVDSGLIGPVQWRTAVKVPVGQ